MGPWGVGPRGFGHSGLGLVPFDGFNPEAPISLN